MDSTAPGRNPHDRDFSNPRFWLDEMGTLWRGPINPDDTLHWGTLEGVCIDVEVADGEEPELLPVWVLRRSTPPADLELISNIMAEKTIDMYRAEHRTRKKRSP